MAAVNAPGVPPLQTAVITVEREATFELPLTFDARRLASALDRYRPGPAQLRRLHTIYFDSDDLRLARWDISLRYRAGEAWTVKLPTRRGDSSALTQLECTFAGTDPAGPPQGALDLLCGTLRGAPVHPVAELRTLRTASRIERLEGGAVAELVCDDVRVVRDGRIVRRCRQLEIELAAGAAPAELEALARHLRRRTLARPTSVTKVRFALGTVDLTRETRVAPLKRHPHCSEVVRCAIAPAVDTLVRADPHLLANGDPEWVHDARVATRKLRSSLKVYAPMLREPWTLHTRAALKRLGDLLGSVRDADVLGERVAALADSIPREEVTSIARITESVGASRVAAYAVLRAALREWWHLALLDTLVAAVRDGPPLASADRTVRPHALVAGAMRRPWKRLGRVASRTGDDASVAELHALRIRAKRVHYAAEAIAPLLHGRRGRKRCRFAKRLARLQDRLGVIHDIAVERDALRAGGEADRFVRGELVGLETARGAALRQGWGDLWRAAARRRFRFWR